MQPRVLQKWRIKWQSYITMLFIYIEHTKMSTNQNPCDEVAVQYDTASLESHLLPSAASRCSFCSHSAGAELTVDATSWRGEDRKRL